MVMRSIKTKMCVFFGVLMLLGGVIFGWVAIEQSSGALVEFLNSQAAHIAENASKEIDHGNFAAVAKIINEANGQEDKLNGVMELPEYKAIQERLNEIRKITGLKYLYTVMKTADEKLVYAVDGMDIDDEDNFSPPGAETNSDELLLEMFETGVPYESEVQHDPQFGYLITAYVPVKSSDGKVLFAVGGDYSADDMMNTASRLRVHIYILVAIVLVVSLFLTYFAARVLSKPILRMVEMVKRVRSGDVSFSRGDFNVKTNDEIGSMADELANMVATQREFLMKTKDAANTALGQSGELRERAAESGAAVGSVSATVKNTYKSFESSSAVIEECNAGIEEVSASATEIAKAAQDGAALSGEIRSLAQRSLDECKEALSNIRESAAHSEERGKALSELSKTVETIGEFMSQIRSVAYQTNLLALNAAIEAARAGDAGRGFGVVADNVRKLAEESGETSKEVDSRVQTLLSVTKKALSLHSESQEKLSDALKRTEDMENMTEKTERELSSLNSVILGIANATDRQDKASNEIVSSLSVAASEMKNIQNNIDEIKSQSEKTGDAANDVTAVAKNLAEQNFALQELMSFYKT